MGNLIHYYYKKNTSLKLGKNAKKHLMKFVESILTSFYFQG